MHADEKEIKKEEAPPKHEYTGVTRFWDPARHPPKPIKEETKSKKKSSGSKTKKKKG